VWDQYFGGSHTTAKLAHLMKGKISKHPHPEGTGPDTVGVLKRSFHDVPVDDTEKLVGLTAAACYGMDLDPLRAIADHIGPTPEDLEQDPTFRSDPDVVANARWWKEKYGLSAP
jgi:hypothetical protein